MDKQFLSVDDMKSILELYGYRQVWLCIEKISDWRDRIVYRNLFFEAGGSLDN